MTRHSRLGPTGLVARQIVANPSASVVVAIIVLVSAFLAGATPRALDQLFTAELRHTVAGVSAPQRDLVATSLGGPTASLSDYLADLRSEMGATLRSATGDGSYLSYSPALPAIADEPALDAPITALALAIDTDVEQNITVVEGELPDAAERLGDFDFAPIQFVLSRSSAADMRWSVGEQRSVRSPTGLVQAFELSGVFDATDADGAIWQINPSIVEPFLYDDGNSTPTVTATGFVNSASVEAAYRVMGGLSTRAWYPVSASEVGFTEATALLQNLREFTSARHLIAGADPLTGVGSFTFSSELVGSLEAVEAKAASTVAVLSMALAGPLGVVLAVLALGARAVTDRRRAGLSLAAARGASRAQLRGVMAVEGILLGVPAAAIGVGLAALLLPAAVGAAATALPLLLGLAPAVLLASAASGARMRTERNDLGNARGSRARTIVELIVVGLAALAVVLLLRRGLTSASGPTVDPLLAATPLLLALAVCVIVLRLYPYPLRAIEAALRKAPGLTSYLGVARAVRDPAAGLAPVLAMVVGVSIAVFSGILVATIDRGVDTAAQATVGADLQVSGPVFGPPLIAELQAIPGVNAVAGVDDAGPGILRVDGVKSVVGMLVVDFAALAELRDVPAGLTTGTPVPVIASSDLAADLPAGARLQVQGVDIQIVASVPQEEGLTVQSRWIMVDRSFSDELTGVGFLPRLVLVDLDPGADTAAVSAAILDVAGASGTVLDPLQAAAQIRSAPTVGGLATALVIAMVIAGALSALAVVMTSVVGSRARTRLLALLATLGLTGRQARGLAAWEIAPIALTAIVAGTLLGVAMPWVVLGGVDLRPFTGGSTQPAITIDPLIIGALVAGFAAVVVLAVFIAVAIGRRMSAASTLRMGEEG